MPDLRQLMIGAENPNFLARFYRDVFDLEKIGEEEGAVFLSDVYKRTEEPLGLNHFGFHVGSNEEMRARAEKAGVAPGARRPDRIPFAEYRVHDPEGNGIDISEKGWKV